MSVAQPIKKRILALVLLLVFMASLAPAALAADVLADGAYTVEISVYKAGTTEASRSAGSVKTPAKLTVSGGKLTAQVAFKSESLTDISVGGTAAQVVAADGEWTTWSFALDSADATVPVTVTVPAMGSRMTIDLVFQGSTVAPASPFDDVKSTDWFFDAVQFAAREGLFSGTSATAFSPGAPMTRAMLVTVLYRLEGTPTVAQANQFTDVKSGEWYTNAVIWANANGVVTGYGGGLFGTNDPVTREQMAKILYGYAQSKGYDASKTADLSVYTDAAGVSAWAQAALAWANAEGFITGRTATTLAPGGSATRAEVASILMRFAAKFAV